MNFGMRFATSMIQCLHQKEDAMSIIKNITLISMFTMVACTEGKDTGEPQSSPSEHWNSGAVGICEVEREDPFTVTDASLDGDTIVVDVSTGSRCGCIQITSIITNSHVNT